MRQQDEREWWTPLARWLAVAWWTWSPIRPTDSDEVALDKLDRRYRWAAASVAVTALLALFFWDRDADAAEEVLVFTLSSMPVRAPCAAIHVLDDGDRLAAALGRDLPGTAHQAAAEVRRRLDAGVRDRLAQAAEGRRLAARLGVERLPAVVVDRRYAVYGVRDLDAALRLVAAWRLRHEAPAGEPGSRAAGRPAVPGGREPLTRAGRAHAGEGGGTGESPPGDSGEVREERRGVSRHRPPARTLPRGERQGTVRSARVVERGATGAEKE